MGRKTKQDPTGQASSRKKARTSLSRRLSGARLQVVRLFETIGHDITRQVKIVNAETEAVYTYQYSPSDQEMIAAGVQVALTTALLGGQDTMPEDWHFKDNIEQPYRQGAAETARDINAQISAAAPVLLGVGKIPPQPVPPEVVLHSPAYRDALAKTYQSSFVSIKGLSEDTNKQIMLTINNGIKARKSPAVISQEISERFDVAKSRANTIADTWINQAYNDARMETVTLMASATGTRAGVIHISALLPTTRETHAARHGNAYTVEDQQAWWDEGANRINCHCTTRPALVDDEGNLIDPTTRERIRAERAYFDK